MWTKVFNVICIAILSLTMQSSILTTYQIDLSIFFMIHNLSKSRSLKQLSDMSNVGDYFIPFLFLIHFWNLLSQLNELQTIKKKNASSIPINFLMYWNSIYYRFQDFQLYKIVIHLNGKIRFQLTGIWHLLWSVIH